MTQKTDPHVFTGMQKDITVSKHKPEYLYDALNIRFTPNGDDTLLSITNERGPLYTQATVRGKYLGHCAFNDCAIVFSTNACMVGNDASQPKWDAIYKISKSGNNWEASLVFIGNLNFSLDNKIETLGVYENEQIRKVYWVDGRNQPRMLIIDRDNSIEDYSNEVSTKYDFVQTLKLEESIQVSRIEGNGMFAPGTIQYAFSYYRLNGQESNIFYTTPLNYISFVDRGGSPEDRVANSFKISISDADLDFDCLRIYSIHRTTLDAVPNCKRVTDIDLSLVDPNNNIITFVDPGTVGDNIDPTELLYIGGETLVAGTLAQKDNTLFLGNINLTRLELPVDSTDFTPSFNVYNNVVEYERNGSDSGYYFYTNGLKYHLNGFKNREHYRLGIQFQHKTGKWSAPVYLEDYVVESEFNPEHEEFSDTVKYTNLHIKGEIDLLHNKGQELIDEGYIKARPVCVFPTINDRLVLTQGILCPTVYNILARERSAPYAQSSWFFRLNPGINISNDASKSWVEFRHNHLLRPENTFGGEIMGNMPPVGTTESRWVTDAAYYPSLKQNLDFAVDQSILTMHSPEIEFDTDIDFMSDIDWKLRLVGIANFTSTFGDINILTSSASLGTGFHHITSGVYDSKNAHNGLAACKDAWFDKTVKERTNNSDSTTYEGSTEDHNFIIYPWHRSGSLNNDAVRADNSVRTSVLDTKKLANLRFSKYNTWFDSLWLDPVDEHNSTISYDITKIQVVQDNEQNLVKISPLDNDVKHTDLSYYGNYDKLLTMDIGNSANADNYVPKEYNNGQIMPITTNDHEVKNSSFGVRMSYRSAKHLLFGLRNVSGGTTKRPQVLPRLQGLTGNTSSVAVTAIPTWYTNKAYNSGSETTANSEDITNYTQVDLFNTEVSLEVFLKDKSGYLDTNFNPNHNPNTCISPIEEDGTAQLYEITRTLDLGLDIYIYSATLVQNFNSNGYFYTDSFGIKHVYKVENGHLQYTGEDTAEIDPITDEAQYPAYRVNQEEIEMQAEYPYLFLAELYREPNADIDFGGNTTEAKLNNLWLPAGEPVSLVDQNNDPLDTLELYYTEGDTWYQRYDCLKTYPYTEESENCIIEIGSFMCETRYNIDGRYDKRRGKIGDILNDRPTNFNLINPVYSNKNNFFSYRALSETFTELNAFPNTITWTLEKKAAEVVDSWTRLTLANTLDMDGKKGPVNALRVFTDNIYCFQDSGISRILFNSRVQLSPSDGVPIEIANSGKVDGKIYITESIGCKNKWSISVTPSGIYFLDNNTKELYNIGSELASISSTHGFSNWFKTKDNHEDLTSSYDFNNNDLYLVWKGDTCLVYSERLGQFTSFMSYENVSTFFNINDEVLLFKDDANFSNLYWMFKGGYNRFFGEFKPFSLTFISNADSTEDKIFSTLESRIDFWVGDTLQNDMFFDYIRAYNEYQDSGEVFTNWDNTPASMRHHSGSNQRKFRINRTDIPRDSGNRLNRIRNTWTKISLNMNYPISNNGTRLDELLSHLGNVVPFNPADYMEGRAIDQSTLAFINEKMTEYNIVAPHNTPGKHGNDYINLRMQLHDLNVQYYI